LNSTATLSLSHNPTQSPTHGTRSGRSTDKDMVLIEGALAEGLSSNLELNGWLANDLSAPLLMIYDCKNDESLASSDVMRRVSIAKDIVSERCQAELAGLILNRVPRHMLAPISEDMRRAAKEQHCAFAGAIPYDGVLNSPRLNEVVKSLRAEFLFGSGDDTDVDVSELLVAAQDVSHLLGKIDALADASDASNPPPKPLVLTTPDRTDILLALGCAHATVGPNVAGVGIELRSDDVRPRALTLSHSRHTPRVWLRSFARSSCATLKEGRRSIVTSRRYSPRSSTSFQSTERPCPSIR